MSFDVSADDHLRFMGRYSEPLAPAFADLAGVAGGQRALDVGCGPGVLTEELVRRVGAAAVSAADPSASFVAAVRERLPAGDGQGDQAGRGRRRVRLGPRWRARAAETVLARRA